MTHSLMASDSTSGMGLGDGASPSRFHAAMRRLLDHMPQKEIALFHPTKGALALWQSPQLHKVFPISRDNVGKDADKSAEYRQQGNNLFQKKKFDEALEMFNLSVMFAPFPEHRNPLGSTGTGSQVNGTSETKTECKDTSKTKPEETGSERNHLEPETGKTNGEAVEITNGAVSPEEDVEEDVEDTSKQQNQKAGNNKKGRQKRNKKKKTKSGKGNPKQEKNVEDAAGQNQQEATEHRPLSNGVETGGNKTQEMNNGLKDEKEISSELPGKKYDYAYTMSYVIANRSASLFFLHLFKDCIDDIDLAMQLGYPEGLKYKLYERKGKCLLQLGKNVEAVECFKKATMCVADAKLDAKGKQNNLLSLGKQIKLAQSGKEKPHTPEKHIRSVKNSIPKFSTPTSPKFGGCTLPAFKMAVDDTRGRHIVAAEDVAIAEMVSFEVPYSSVLYPEYYTTHCNACMTRVVVATPCRQCTRVLYCSATCEAEAWQAYHQVECPVLSWLQPTWVGRLGHLALRTALVTGYGTLRTFFGDDSEAASLQRMSAFDADGKYATGYASVYHLVANLESRTPENIFNFALIAAFLMKIFFTGVACLFQSYTQQVDTNETPSDVTAAADVAAGGIPSGPSLKQLEILSLALTHHLQIIQCNGFAIPEMQGKEDFRTYVPRDIGVGLYPVHGLVNHSCNPDLDLCYYGNVMVSRAVKGITKGNEMCVDYGVLFFTQSKSTRHEILRSQYYFTCACPPCVEDWPLWENIECTTPTFKCGHCQKALPRVGGAVPVPTHIECPHCAQETPVMRNLNELNASHQRYAIAMRLKAESDNDAILRALLDHLTTMDQFIAAPWRDFVSCQSSVKQSFRLMGSWHHVRGEIPPPEKRKLAKQPA